jgi:DNA-directed RNA polymerase subunit F
MINKAIEKLTDEMMKMNSPFAQAIGEHLTGHCVQIEVAEKILQEDKTLKGACEEIRETAKKSQKGGVGIISDSDAYKMAEEYFGITKQEEAGVVNILDLI